MISIVKLSNNNFNINSLDEYKRTQTVTKVYRRKDGEYRLVDLPYIEDWSLDKKRKIAEELCGNEYITYLAFEGERIIGLVSLVKELKGDHMILDLMQVDADYRKQGLGRKLFEVAREEAVRSRAKSLYISACSSEETIAFYYAMGAKLTDNPIKEMAENEPYDLQLVCML